MPFSLYTKFFDREGLETVMVSKPMKGITFLLVLDSEPDPMCDPQT